MRINVFIAQATGLSRRTADEAIAAGRVRLNGAAPQPGAQAGPEDAVTLDGRTLHLPARAITIILNKPVGYVCSRNGQGSKTVYELLSPNLRALKPVGRLDKNSSGLLLLTTDGQLAQTLTHPSYQKEKVYEVRLDKPLTPAHWQRIDGPGVPLADGPSRFALERLGGLDDERVWRVTMREGRNRQIRRTFAALGYDVRRLHRTHFGPYALSNLAPGAFKRLTPER